VVIGDFPPEEDGLVYVLVPPHEWFALYGWEDYDLWCRCAERGVDGVFLAQIVASYRSSGHSMISMTDISVASAFSVLCERYPKLMAGVTPPP